MNVSLLRPRDCIGLCLVAFVSLSAAAANTPAPAKSMDSGIAVLDAHFQDFSAHFYAKFLRGDKQTKVSTIGALTKAIARARYSGERVRAVAAILGNRELVEAHIDSHAIVPMMALLLEANEWKIAARLYDRLKDQGDKVLLANVALPLAKYHFAREHWEETVQAAQAIGSELPAEDFHHARLLHGVALQRLRKHRASLVQYAKISPTSRFYTAAQLNMALADIHQDWWTDAHVIIQQLLKDNPHHDDLLVDRLYTVLGYSFLHQQYFRSARDAFRNVGTDGPYTHKALLGIALCAAYQNDYVGALNAVTLLKNKTTHDLPVDEAHLLTPYFYEKLDQHATAMAGYSQALRYFEDRISAIQSVAVDGEHLRKSVLAGNGGIVTVGGEVLDLGARLPQAYFDNLSLLSSFQPYVKRLGDSGLEKEYSALEREYLNALHKAVREVLAEKVSFLNDYMSQARFGLATVHDNGAVVAPQ